MSRYSKKPEVLESAFTPPGAEDRQSLVVPLERDNDSKVVVAVDEGGRPSGKRIAERILIELGEAGSIHAETLAAVEGTEEWANYEANVALETALLRIQYGATASDEPMTSQRRSQMQAHVRQKQGALMEEHADAAARAYVESVTPTEVRSLRQLLTRIDAKPRPSGPGREGARGEVGRVDLGDVHTIDGQGLKEALWSLSAELGKAAGTDGPALRAALSELGLYAQGPQPRVRKGHGKKSGE